MTNCTVSPPWRGGGDRALALQSKVQWLDRCRRQLEKVVNLDENSWTHTNYKTSLRWPKGCWATMSDAVHLVHVRHSVRLKFGISIGAVTSSAETETAIY